MDHVLRESREVQYYIDIVNGHLVLMWVIQLFMCN